MRRFLISICIAAGALVGAAAPAVAAPQLPPTCAGKPLAVECAAYTGTLYRAALSHRGVQRPLVTNRNLGLVAQDICRFNDVRPNLESILFFPDSRVVDFFVTARSVAC
jgi:hypothetical protein